MRLRRNRVHFDALRRELANDVLERQPRSRLSGARRGACGIPAQAEAAVLPIGQQENGLASAAPREKFARGQIHGAINV